MGESRMTAVTVVIPVHSEGRLPGLRAAIASVLDQDLEVVALLVVVDHHQALLHSLRVEFADHERVQVVPNRYAAGASGARNSGADLAQTPIVAFLDSDAVAQPSWLRALIAPLEQDQVVGTGGRVVPRWAPARPKWFPDEFGWVVGVEYLGQRASPGPVRNVWAENMAVRTDRFRAVGGFRVSFGKVGGVSRPEDTDLCMRMSLASAGATWIYVPDAVVEHDVGQIRSQFRFFLARSYSEGRGKVELARLNRGSQDLQSERDWLLRTLPCGLAHYAAASVRDPQQLLRAGAALLGGTAAGLGAAMALAAPHRH